MIEKLDLVPYESPRCKRGDVFGRLTVIETGRLGIKGRPYAVCRCSCGSEPFIVRLDSLSTESKSITRSCGCLHRESVTKHGMWNSPLYRAWRSMHERCYDPRNKRWANYGGKGITVCHQWHDLLAFVEDMGHTYAPGLQIDRIDNSMGYSPDNCRWADRGQQARNKTSNINLTFNGQTKCLAEWARIVGLTYGTLWDRIKVQKWSVEKALTTPPVPTEESVRLAHIARWGR